MIARDTNKQRVDSQGNPIIVIKGFDCKLVRDDKGRDYVVPLDPWNNFDKKKDDKSSTNYS